jgi:hypothetical protein
MGLWDLRNDGNGVLERHPTGLERRYADLVAAEGYDRPEERRGAA